MLLQQYPIPYIYITLLPIGFISVNMNDIIVDNEFCLCFAVCKSGNTTPQSLFRLHDSPPLERHNISTMAPKYLRIIKAENNDKIGRIQSI